MVNLLPDRFHGFAPALQAFCKHRASAAQRRGAQKRQALPWVPVEKDHTFETDDGTKTPAELRAQLFVYHFMFGPRVQGWPDAGCPGCSAKPRTASKVPSSISRRGAPRHERLALEGRVVYHTYSCYDRHRRLERHLAAARPHP